MSQNWAGARGERAAKFGIDVMVARNASLDMIDYVLHGCRSFFGCSMELRYTRPIGGLVRAGEKHCASRASTRKLGRLFGRIMTQNRDYASFSAAGVPCSESEET